MHEPANEPISRSGETPTSDATTTQSPQTEPRAPWANAISLAEAGLLTDVGIVFDLAWIYVPLLGTAFAPLIPTPFVILYLRRGARITLFAAIVAGFLMTVLVGPHYGWRLSLEACIGLAMGWAMRRRWSPVRAITLGLFINATVAYVAAFAAVFALGLPLHDLYLELRNVLLSLEWLLDTSARLLGVQSVWDVARPWFALVGHVTLSYWIPMFYLYIMALAFPVVLLYYSVASTTAFALGHDVRPFPSPWMWRVLRVVGLLLSPFTWLARLLWRVVTLPLWGPLWIVRSLAAVRRRRRLREELAATDAAEALSQVAASETLPGMMTSSNGASGELRDEALLETATPGREARDQ